MRFKIDENLPTQAAVLLNDNGHDALTIHDQEMAGEADARVSSVCQFEQRALITLDLDFSLLFFCADPAEKTIMMMMKYDREWL